MKSLMFFSWTLAFSGAVNLYLSNILQNKQHAEISLWIGWGSLLLVFINIFYMLSKKGGQ